MKRSKKRFIWIIIAILLMAGSSLSAYFILNTQKQTNITDDVPVSQHEDLKSTSKAEQILTEMTLEEKIGQMFMVDTADLEHGTRTSDNELSLNEAQKANLAQYGLGGVIFFAGNIQSAEQVQSYINELQANSKYPLLVSTDQEGGSVDRLANAGITHFGNMADIGATGDPDNAYQVGATYGKEMRNLGFNVNLAPIADINTNPNNPVIGVRSFGNDASLVAKMVASEVRGLQDNNISAALKHFPGHGDTSADTHTGMATIDHDINRLREIELVPFKSGIEADAGMVLAAHIKLPNVDAEDIPASMSKTLIADILRGEMGYNGVVITDALDMGAIAQYYTNEQVVEKCIEAGVDILLMPVNYFEAYETLLNLVNSGTVPQSRIDESVLRILNLKLKFNVMPN
jgi:Beta-glucosidase-related glycosidases